MGLLFLTNTVGNNSSAVALANPLGVVDGYDVMDVLSGPRCRTLRSKDLTTHGVTYTLNDTTAMTHAVLTHAHLFVNHAAGSYHRFLADGAIFGGTPTQSTIESGLVGPYGQDWVQALSQSANTTFESRFVVSDSSSHVERGKLYLSSSFNFDVEPLLNGSGTPQLDNGNTRARPLIGHEWYETEHIYRMTFPDVTRSKKAEFEALPLRWPFFLYDADQEHWEHKLEHVIMTKYDYSHVSRNYYDIQLEFRRLRHCV